MTSATQSPDPHPSRSVPIPDTFESIKGYPDKLKIYLMAASSFWQVRFFDGKSTIKRVYRIYRELELNLRIKPRHRLVREKPMPLAVPAQINDTWSMGRWTSCMTSWLMAGLGIELDFSLPSERVIRSLDRIIEWRGKPLVIRCDNGPEHISAVTLARAAKRGIRIDFIQPGQPQQNAYVERYNRTVRYDWLAHHLFETLDEIQDFATRWLWTYNHDRPNMALGGITPKQKLALAA
eukprot:gene18086-21614_t